MSDFESFRREAGAQVMPPGFDELVTTSRRRRRTAAASAIVAVAAVVSVVAFGLQGVYGDRAAPVPPVGPTLSPTPTPTAAPTPTPTPTPTKDTSPSPDERPQRLTPSEIVHHPRAGIAAVAVSESSTDAKAVVWRYCSDRRNCNRQVFALAVTSDNFETSHAIAIPRPLRGFSPDVRAIGPDTFYVAATPNGWLVDSKGNVTEIEVTHVVRPLTPADVLVRALSASSNPYLGVDPQTGIAHLVPLPVPGGGGVTQLEQNADGTLVGLVQTSAPTFVDSVIWSVDGGATWDKHPLSESSNALTQLVPSTSTSPILAVVEGGDGATLFPFDKLHRSTDGGATWQTFDVSRGVMGYLGWSLVNPDGSLLVNIEAWSDARHARPSARPAGLYESDGTDWSSLHFVDSPPDGSDPEAAVSGLTLGDYTVTDSGALRLWLHGYTSGKLLESGTGFDTWAEVPAR